jgi:hypothetical protein
MRFARCAKLLGIASLLGAILAAGGCDRSMDSGEGTA